MKEKNTQIDETLHAQGADGQNSTDSTNTGPAQEHPEPGDTEGAAAVDIPAKQIANTDDEKIAKLVAEAEQRGYMRGLNERMSEQMNQPRLYEDLARRPAAPAGGNYAADEDPLTSGFLSAVRANVWD